MSQDPIAELKQKQREMWATFAPFATFTTPAAANLVDFAGIQAGESVLDVGTGTGVVAVTAARRGTRVSAIDLTPELIDVARLNGEVAQVANIDWRVGDAEQLPYPDASFDVVVSQFGHMFAPRPEIAIAEMRRVLKPGGRVAFSTWPPEHFVGQMFALVGRHSPPLPPGASPPPQWGAIPIVTERLANGFGAPFFERGTMFINALSLPHLREMMERAIGPMQKLVERLAAEPDKLRGFRDEFEALAAPYFRGNQLHQSYLLTRAIAS